MRFYIAGLGNPGKEYELSRHNAGSFVLSYLRAQFGFPELRSDKKKKSAHSRGKHMEKDITLIFPETFMNESGRALKNFIARAADKKRLIVIHDDLDLPIGSFKISFDRGPGGHKGVLGIARALRGNDFYRIRIGTSPRTVSGKLKKISGAASVKKFVLSRFGKKEIEAVQSLFPEILKGIGDILDGRR